MPPKGREFCWSRTAREEKLLSEKKHHLHIELTKAQYALLQEKSKQCGLTKKGLLTRLLEEKEIRALPTKELKDLRMEIHKIGNNINQIARKMNAGIAREKEASDAIQLLAQVYELMYQIAKK